MSSSYQKSGLQEQTASRSNADSISSSSTGKSYPAQMQGGKEEELMQGKFAAPAQLMGGKEDELMQGKFASPAQLMGGKEDELMQGKFAAPAQLQAAPEDQLMQGKFVAQRQANNTGMSDQLKTGVESLSGTDLSDVKVHYNSAAPAQLNALAYAQGTDIHIAPGQEQHLPHEAWHVAQQKQGRVTADTQLKAGVPVNTDPGLEHEADVMGARAMAYHPSSAAETQIPS